MSWRRAESLANYNETNTSVISKAKVIYWASQEDLDRFDALRKKADNTSKEFLKKASEQVNICQDFYFNMLEGKSSFSIVKRNGVCILYYSALDEVFSVHKDKNIVVGTHGTALSTIISYYDPSYGLADFMKMLSRLPRVVRMDFDNHTFYEKNRFV